MQMLRVLLADVDETHVRRMMRVAARSRDIEIIGVCRNGNQVLKDIGLLRPDVLLMDIQLPGLDGIMVLKELQTFADVPTTIVCTRFYSENCVVNACRYGADYFLYKPLDYARVPEIIRHCRECRASERMAPFDRDDDANLNDAARALLSELGIPAKLSGGIYLMESLMCLSRQEQLMKNLSKGLYVEIAERLDTTPVRVERCLRNAIAVAYDRGALSRVFPHRPTNRQVLKYLAKRVREQGDALNAGI